MLADSSQSPRVNPLAQLGGLMLILVPVLVSFDPWTPLVTLGVSVAWLIPVLRPDLDKWITVLKPLVYLALSLFLLNWVFPASREGQAWVEWGPFRPNLQSFEVASAVAVRSVVLGALSTLVASSFGPMALVRALMHQGNLSPVWGFSLFAGLNALPFLGREAETMNLTRKIRLRGREKWGESWGMPVVLLASALRRAERTALTLRVRGVDRPGPRTSLMKSHWEPKDVVFLVLAGGMGGSLVVLSLIMKWFEFDLG